MIELNVYTDAIRFGVGASYGVALGAVAVAETASILLGRWIYSPITGHSLSSSNRARERIKQPN